MRNAKLWMFGAFLTAALAGTALFSASSFSSAEPVRVAAGHDHWHYHDGHWSYWHEGDHRWYYTDGAQWYYNDGGDNAAWQVYRFDKDHKFGDDFERDEYRPPEEGVKIELPHHKIYIGK